MSLSLNMNNSMARGQVAVFWDFMYCYYRPEVPFRDVVANVRKSLVVEKLIEEGESFTFKACGSFDEGCLVQRVMEHGCQDAGIQLVDEGTPAMFDGIIEKDHRPLTLVLFSGRRSLIGYLRDIWGNTGVKFFYVVPPDFIFDKGPGSRVYCWSSFAYGHKKEGEVLRLVGFWRWVDDHGALDAYVEMVQPGQLIEEGNQVSVFWDLDSCPHPSDVSFEDAVHKIKKAVGGVTVEFSAYGDRYIRMPIEVEERAGGVKLVRGSDVEKRLVVDVAFCVRYALLSPSFTIVVIFGLQANDLISDLLDHVEKFYGVQVIHIFPDFKCSGFRCSLNWTSFIFRGRFATCCMGEKEELYSVASSSSSSEERNGIAVYFDCTTCSLPSGVTFEDVRRKIREAIEAWFPTQDNEIVLFKWADGYGNYDSSDLEFEKELELENESLESEKELELENESLEDWYDSGFPVGVDKLWFDMLLPHSADAKDVGVVVLISTLKGFEYTLERFVEKGVRVIRAIHDRRVPADFPAASLIWRYPALVNGKVEQLSVGGRKRLMRAGVMRA